MRLIIVLISLFVSIGSNAQSTKVMPYEASELHPFGLLNPEAPPEVADFKPLIGVCDCISFRRNPDGSWQDSTNLIWKFKYIMNGTAVQDETWQESGLYASSIRQYHADSAFWVVTYFSFPSVAASPTSWTGNKSADKIVLKSPQQAPNGMNGYSRLTFYDINSNGFRWKGEWVDENETIVYPFWRINCKKI